MSVYKPSEFEGMPGVPVFNAQNIQFSAPTQADDCDSCKGDLIAAFCPMCGHPTTPGKQPQESIRDLRTREHARQTGMCTQRLERSCTEQLGCLEEELQAAIDNGRVPGDEVFHRCPRFELRPVPCPGGMQTRPGPFGDGDGGLKPGDFQIIGNGEPQPPLPHRFPPDGSRPRTPTFDFIPPRQPSQIPIKPFELIPQPTRPPTGPQPEHQPTPLRVTTFQPVLTATPSPVIGVTGFFPLPAKPSPVVGVTGFFPLPTQLPGGAIPITPGGIIKGGPISVSTGPSGPGAL